MNINDLFSELNISNNAKQYFLNLPEYAQRHSFRVMVLADKSGICLNLNKDNLLSLKRASLFHDIGKLKFPKWIHYNKKQLSLSEFKKYIISHPNDSKNILIDLNEFNNFEMELAKNHHEKLNGKGYP